MKNIWASKINWAALVIIATSFQSQFTGLDLSKMTVQSWVTFAIGIVVIVLRTLTDGTPIGTPSDVKAFKTGSNPDLIVVKDNSTDTNG